LLMLGNRLLQPVENAIQKKFWNEAHEKLLALKPTVIGITGSFGKTSVKHILGHVLKMQARTLITPGSVNTPMGITRIIRERLDESIKYFVVEMGAYAPGSIEKLCKLAPPDMGIVTAIGHAHYERFKTLDVVAETKFALPIAALAKNGKVVVAEQVLNFPYTKQVYKDHAGDFIVCGEGENNALRIWAVSQSDSGIDVTITWKGENYVLELPLFGEHHGHNAALVFAAAATLGMAPEHIIAALKSTPQIEYRLEIKRQPDSSIIIDDAFNSNPTGFKSALEVLSMLATENQGRAILITPGMVEMGAAHDDEHYKIGTIAGGICDVALIVMPERIGAFIKGFKESGPTKTIIEMRSFAEAAKWLDANRKRGDVVLIENDLPDIYEAVPRI
jgi:UDP-N-acetylmuramoyl-tripeptide--D-alanyl-D-alanine ligase